jgi:hypothetical protein
VRGKGEKGIKGFTSRKPPKGCRECVKKRIKGFNPQKPPKGCRECVKKRIKGFNPQKPPKGCHECVKKGLRVSTRENREVKHGGIVGGFSDEGGGYRGRCYSPV